MVARSSSVLFFPPLSARSSIPPGRNHSSSATMRSPKLWRCGRFFEQDRFPGNLQRDSIEQRLRGDDGFEFALRGAGRERLRPRAV